MNHSSQRLPSRITSRTSVLVSPANNRHGSLGPAQKKSKLCTLHPICRAGLFPCPGKKTSLPTDHVPMSWYHAALTPDGCPGTTRFPDPTDPSPVARFRLHPGPQLVESSDGGAGGGMQPLPHALSARGRQGRIQRGKRRPRWCPPRDACTRPGCQCLSYYQNHFQPDKKRKSGSWTETNPPLPGEQANRYLDRLRSNILDAGFTEAADCFRGECNRKREHHSRLAKEDNRSGGHTRGRQEWVNPYVCMGEAF